MYIYTHILPSGYVKIAIENGPFIVSCPIKTGDFPPPVPRCQR